MKIKLLLTSLLLAFITACAPGSSDPDENAQYQKDQDKLNSEYEPAIGTYRGTLQTRQFDNSGQSVDLQIPIQALIFTALEKTGAKDAQGKDILTSVLKMRYRQEDIVRPDSILSVRFTPSTGAITASDNSTSVVGNLIDNQITGSVNRGGGIVGNFVLTFVSKEVNVPISDSEDLYNRLNAQNQRIQGAYIGVVTDKAGVGQTTFKVRLDLRADTTLDPATGQRKAVLTGKYSRLDLSDPDIGTRIFNDVVFRENTFPAILYMKFEGGLNNNFMIIYGNLIDGVLEGKMEDNRGQGNIRVVKQASKRR